MLNKRILGLAALASLAGSSLAVGPIGLWMLTDGDSQTDALIQGGSVNTYAQGPDAVRQYAIQYDPVFDLFETVGRDQNDSGGLYDASHNLVGYFGNYSSSDGEHLDGTLDTKRNRTIVANYTHGTILRYNDQNFNSPTSVVWDTDDFSVWSVTYDPRRDSLFVGGWNTITEIDTNGNVLNSFATTHGPVRSLAYDRSDNTMWYLSLDGNTAVQIDAVGSVLSTMTVNLGGNYWGGEIRAVPEPATMAVLGLGAAALIRRRRK